MTSAPDTTPRIGYSRSGGRKLDAARVIAASASTPRVCDTVTARPEPDGLPAGAPAADEVGGHDRLAVPRRERVDDAEREGDGERDEDRERRQVLDVDERREVLGDRRPGTAPRAPPRHRRGPSASQQRLGVGRRPRRERRTPRDTSTSTARMSSGWARRSVG